MSNIIKKVRSASTALYFRCMDLVEDRKGEVASDTLGIIIVGVIIAGLLIAAVRLAFPGIFANLFTEVEAKLHALWT